MHVASTPVSTRRGRRTNTLEAETAVVDVFDVGRLATDNGKATVASPAAADKRNTSGNAKGDLTTVVKFTVQSPWNSVWVWRVDSMNFDHSRDKAIIAMQCWLQQTTAVLLALSYVVGGAPQPDIRMNTIITMLAVFPMWVASSLLVFWPTRAPSKPGEDGTRITFVYQSYTHAVVGITTVCWLIFPAWVASYLLVLWPMRAPSEPGVKGTRITFVYRSYVSAAAGIVTICWFKCVRMVLLNDNLQAGYSGHISFGARLSWVYSVGWQMLAVFQFAVGAAILIDSNIENLFAQCTGAVARCLARISHACAAKYTAD